MLSKLALLALALAAVALWLRHGDAPAEMTSTPREVARAQRPVHVDATAEPRSAPAKLALPPSLQGTDEDGAWPLDAAGHLRVGPALLQRLAYLFAATGEEPESTILARIRAEIANLREPARSEATAFLEKYLRYRARGRDLQASSDPRQALAALHALRVEIFGSDADALFGESERTAALALDARDHPEQAAALEAQRSPEDRAARDASTVVLRREQEEAELRREGATDEDLHQYRLETVGPEATARLDALDQARAEFQHRFADYESRKASMAPSDADELLQQAFTPGEQLRVRALERIQAAQATR